MKKLAVFILITIVICQGFSDTQWEGDWFRNSLLSSANITITAVENNTFSFEIDANSGANTGHIEGTAIFNKNTASAHLEEFDVKSEVHFKHTGTSIEITTIDCEIYAGNGVLFEGTYSSKRTSEEYLSYVHMINILDNKELVESIRSITKDYFSSIAYCMHIIWDGKNIDDFSANVKIGCVQGICPYMQAIIMVAPDNRFYIAYLDDEKIRYFSSDQKYKYILPKTIQEWKKEFPEKKVIF